MRTKNYAVQYVMNLEMKDDLKALIKKVLQSDLPTGEITEFVEAATKLVKSINRSMK